MESAQRSFELQAQIKQNAEEIKNACNDLYNWQKEIKDKEKDLLREPQQQIKEAIMAPVPIRSHIKDQDAKQSANSNNVALKQNLTNGLAKAESVKSPATEKQDTPYDPLELKRKEANEFKDRGNKRVKLGEYQLAIEEYTNAIQLHPTEAIYYSNRALCYLKLERYDECIEDCERAIDIDNLAVKAYYRRMMANESLGNNMDALKDCTTILMLEPKNSEAKRCLERINERLRKQAKTTNGPSFSALHSNMIDILPIDKSAYKRSGKPLKRIPIVEVVGPKDSKNLENLKITDEDIDKLFNSNCGNFEEIKNPSAGSTSSTQQTTTTLIKENKPLEETKQKETVETKTENIIKHNNLEDTNETSAPIVNTKERSLPPSPTSTAQFYSNWKELTAEQKYLYLKSIPQSQLCKVLGAGFDSDTLSDIIYTLRDYFLLHKDPATASTLLEVSKNKQLFILSLLMSNEERKALWEIVNSLKENNSLDTASLAQIMKNFNIN